MLTGRVRLSYPNLLTPSESQYSTGKYLTSFIVDEADEATLAMVKELINNAVKVAREGEWKGKKGAVDADRIHELDTELQTNGDKWTVRCSGGNRPIPVIDPLKQDVTDPTKVYGGAYARLMIRAFTWTQPGRMGVSLQCEAVQLLGGGEPYGSNGPDMGAFDVVDDAAPLKSVTQQTAGGASDGVDDLPF